MLPKLFFIIVSTLISSFIFSTHSYNTQCLHHQKTLLLQFKNDLTFDSSVSTKLVRWNESDDCCKWPGVECDAAGNVISLQLDYEFISGGIADSSSLFKLMHLQKLNLAYNSFNNTPIPKGDNTKLLDFHQHNGNEAIVTVDDTVHPVKNEGDVVINGQGDKSITLNSVFHVPGVKKNLLSVANVVDSGTYVLFGPHDVQFLCNIKELKADVVHTGKRIQDMFVLSASSSYINKMNRNENAQLWHARLGHLNFNKLKVMMQKNLVDGLPNLTYFGDEHVWEGCQYGKVDDIQFSYLNKQECLVFDVSVNVLFCCSSFLGM